MGCTQRVTGDHERRHNGTDCYEKAAGDDYQHATSPVVVRYQSATSVGGLILNSEREHYGKKETKDFKEYVYRCRRHHSFLGLYCDLGLLGLEPGRMVCCFL